MLWAKATIFGLGHGWNPVHRWGPKRMLGFTGGLLIQLGQRKACPVNTSTRPTWVSSAADCSPSQSASSARTLSGSLANCEMATRMLVFLNCWMAFWMASRDWEDILLPPTSTQSNQIPHAEFLWEFHLQVTGCHRHCTRSKTCKLAVDLDLDLRHMLKARAHESKTRLRAWDSQVVSALLLPWTCHGETLKVLSLSRETIDTRHSLSSTSWGIRSNLGL